ncbi:MAG TPA: threonine ammonia-lyase [Actinomycetota bacterium]|nr:threonine ammonia-lyase [Actinomycetota bacterium]
MTTLGEVQEAAELLSGVARRTPILTSSSLDERVGGRVLIKAEHLQRTGSFKVRGAYVRLHRCTRGDSARGVVAASAGNHAQGVAWAASELSIASTIVMPVFAPLQKVEATRRYGAEVVLHGETFEESLAHAQELAADRGALFVHPFDDPHVIAGQGTVGLEILAEAGEVDRVVVPLGGGGLISGIATAVKALAPGVEVVGVHPAATPHTIADGAAVKEPGELTRPIIDDLVDRVIELGEDDIADAILFALERTKQVIEGAGVLALAAMLAGAVPAAGRTVAVCSGGNIDPGLLMRVIRHGLGAAHRYLVVSLTLDDRPGQLRMVMDLLASMLVNVLSVVHHRSSPRLAVGAVEVELTLETRDRSHADEVVRALEEAGYGVRK